jgi:hypothetical protein
MSKRQLRQCALETVHVKLGRTLVLARYYPFTSPHRVHLCSDWVLVLGQTPYSVHIARLVAFTHDEQETTA